MSRILQALYARLGRWYLRLAVAGLFCLAFPVAAGGALLLTLYADVSWTSFGRIVAVAEVVVLVEVLLSVRLAFRRIRRADPWLRGERTPETALEAWRALMRLPIDLLRGRLALLAVVDIAIISAFVVWELGGPWFPGLLGIMAGCAVVVLYGAFLRFFGLELVARPVLSDVAGDVPARGLEGERTVSLKWRLLVALPAANIITGVIVAGVAEGDGSLGALGLGVAIAIGVAFTVSFELTLLLVKSILAPLGDLRRGTERVARGDLGTRVPVLGTDETGQLARSFNEMVAGLQERERLREAFGTFVDPDVAERVLRDGALLEGEEVEVSVLFLDIRGFTAYAERTEAREVVARLNDFYERVVPVLLRHGGHANKFVGDGLLGVFGAPDRLGDHADRAVDAAIELATLVDEAYRGELRVGVGVNSGPVLAGTIGGGGRLEFTVIGDAVNTASRVEQLTRETGDTVLVTDATRRLLAHDHGGFVVRPAVELRGKRERVALFAPCATTAPGGEAPQEPVVARVADTLRP